VIEITCIKDRSRFNKPKGWQRFFAEQLQVNSIVTYSKKRELLVLEVLTCMEKSLLYEIAILDLEASVVVDEEVQTIFPVAYQDHLVEFIELLDDLLVFLSGEKSVQSIVKRYNDWLFSENMPSNQVSNPKYNY
jgi:hypothetical protein